jgi:hypothetical protein
MTLEEAKERIGHKVAYVQPGAPRLEEGVITSVNKTFVFVRYGADMGSKATRPEDLVTVP